FPPCNPIPLLVQTVEHALYLRAKEGDQVLHGDSRFVSCNTIFIQCRWRHWRHIEDIGLSAVFRMQRQGDFVFVNQLVDWSILIIEITHKTNPTRALS